MNYRELPAYESFIRVSRMVRRHPSLFEASKRSNALALLEEVIAKMEAADKAKLVSDGTSQELKTQIENASTYLKLCMETLAGAAKKAGLQDGRSVQIFRVPYANDPPLKRIAMARAAADLAVPHEQALMQAGMPPNFIAELRAAAEATEQLLGGKIDAKGAKTNARGILPKLVMEGRTRVDVLEGQLKPHFVGGMAAEFAEAKSLGRVHRPKAKDALPSPESQATAAEANVVRQLEADPANGELKALPLWSSIMQFFARVIRPKEPEPIIDVEYTVEEVKRLPAPEEPPG